MSPYDKRYSYDECMAALCVHEWVIDEANAKETKHLNRMGAWDMRDFSFALGSVIEQAFNRLDHAERETLMHGLIPDDSGYEWDGIGDYDFSLIPLCVKHVIDIAKTTSLLGGDVRNLDEITVDIIHDFLRKQMPDWVHEIIKKEKNS